MYEEVLVTNGENITVGHLFFRRNRGLEWQEFKYDNYWIENEREIDPEIPLYEGIHRASLLEFGCFSDASPDSWGRALIKRYWKKTKNKNFLFTSEYLLSVSDKFRIGDFRFFSTDGQIIQHDCGGIPAEKDIRYFQYLITEFQEGESIKDKDFLDIITYGSSLGGARPKLSIVDADNSLWIAKFSSINDTYDNPAREAVSFYLANACSLNVPEYKLISLSDHKSVFLVKRFDRDGERRIPYLSAKTFLQAKDGSSNNYSYLDIGGIIESTSYDTTEDDLRELFKRLIFNVLVGNKDDHFRNHGFLYIDKAWRLSPVFDLEISPGKSSHSLALDDIGSLSCTLEQILETSEYYGLSYEEARQLTLMIADIVFDWKITAKKLFITDNSIKLMPEYDEYVDEVKKIKSCNSVCR